MPTSNLENADVVVVGLGPAGLLSCILLGQRGYHVIGVERYPTPYPLPRAVTMDHEVARMLASLGINADSDPALEHHDDHYYWVNGKDEILLDIDWFTKAEDGWRTTYWFAQPVLEERLRGIISSLPNVELRPGFEVNTLTQDDSGVTVGYREVVRDGARTVPRENGRTGSIRSKFALGSDGANSFMRRAVGYEYTDLQFYYDWVVVDVTPEVMSAYKWPHYQICNPARPTSVVPGGPGRRRWEFMVLPGEDPQATAEHDKVWEFLKPFGLNPDNAHLDRSVAWRFQGKYVENWRAGRVMLVGDAAHLMPPFAGEGMCAAFRDVYNLIWRMDLVLRGISGMKLLDDWSNERREHVKYYIHFSVDLGHVICVTDEEKAAERDRRLKAEYARQRKPIAPHKAVLGPGTWNETDKLAGRPSIQGEVAFKGRTGRFDDVVGRGWYLISKVGDHSTLSAEQLQIFGRIGGQVVTVGPRGSRAQVIDLENTYGNWMEKNGVAHLLVRPDYFVAATAKNEADLRSSFDRVMSSFDAGNPQ